MTIVTRSLLSARLSIDSLKKHIITAQITGKTGKKSFEVEANSRIWQQNPNKSKLSSRNFIFC
jgi:hypothetical protein